MSVPTRWSHVPLLKFFKFTVGRALVLFIALSLFLVWHGVRDLQDALAKIQWSSVIKFDLTGIKVDFGAAGLAGYKALICLGLGGTISFLILAAIREKTQWYIDTETARKTDADRSAQMYRLAELLHERAGMKEIYASDPKYTLHQQPYAADICVQLARSRTLRILSIAGYEFLGKGSASLLYNEVLERPDLAVEVIILDPDENSASAEVIGPRLKQLRKRDSRYTSEQLRTHIRKTISTMERLKHIREEQNSAEVAVYTIDHHPIFRLLVLDDTIFLSTYENERHGHESAVFMFERVAEESGRESLYAAYAAYFEAMRSGATRVV